MNKNYHILNEFLWMGPSEIDDPVFGHLEKAEGKYEGAVEDLDISILNIKSLTDHHRQAFSYFLKNRNNIEHKLKATITSLIENHPDSQEGWSKCIKNVEVRNYTIDAKITPDVYILNLIDKDELTYLTLAVYKHTKIVDWAFFSYKKQDKRWSLSRGGSKKIIFKDINHVDPMTHMIKNTLKKLQRVAAIDEE